MLSVSTKAYNSAVLHKSETKGCHFLLISGEKVWNLYIIFSNNSCILNGGSLKYVNCMSKDCQFIIEYIDGRITAFFHCHPPILASVAHPIWFELFTHNLRHFELTILCEIKFLENLKVYHNQSALNSISVCSWESQNLISSFVSFSARIQVRIFLGKTRMCWRKQRHFNSSGDLCLKNLAFSYKIWCFVFMTSPGQQLHCFANSMLI